MNALWRAVRVDPGYFAFWSLVIVGLAMATLPLWWELRGIRRALETLARR